MKPKGVDTMFSFGFQIWTGVIIWVVVIAVVVLVIRKYLKNKK
ncbi:hypothetical protein EMERY_42 [Brevibacillus phage Emery]|nr:hypothetical protein EMERY_42 [Brevibacillus phage Emery]